MQAMADPVYKVIFQNQSEIYEVYAKQVYQSDMYGFIEIEEFVFGERSQMIVDPSEEKLKNILPEFFRQKNGPSLLEVDTPRILNDKILLGYFDFIT